jgi:hypothetical protein
LWPKLVISINYLTGTYLKQGTTFAEVEDTHGQNSDRLKRTVPAEFTQPRTRVARAGLRT